MGTTHQKIVFVTLYISYFLNVYLRRSVTFALPEIAQSEALDENQLGLMLSGQMMAYAACKFLWGIFIDFLSPRLVMSVGLIASGMSALMFASVHGSVWLFTLCWMFNGMAGSPGWPAAAIIMKNWYREDQYATAWSILSTTMNVAGVLGPLISACVITYSGWRSSFIIPGTLAVCFGVLQYFTVSDGPAESTSNIKQNNQNKSSDNVDKLLSRKELFQLPGYLGVCICYGIVGIVQYGTLQWGPVYLVNDLGHSIITGNSYLSSLEVGGIIGALIAGYCSDSMLSENSNERSQVIRQYVIAWFTSGLVVFLFLLTYCITTYSSLMWINIIGFGIGLTINGPVAIYGVTAIECAPKHMAGTSHAFASLFSSVGQSAAGLPLSFIAKFWGWKKAFLLQMFLALILSGYLFIYTTKERQKTISHKKQE
ncbi:hypothetical protein ACF0H5_015388 [Mactra antiquata]